MSKYISSNYVYGMQNINFTLAELYQFNFYFWYKIHLEQHCIVYFWVLD